MPLLDILLIVLVLLVCNAWYYLRVLRPVSRLSAQAKALERGDLTALETPVGGISEIDELRRAMLAMSEHVRRAQAQHAAYAGQVADSREDERKRIARDLHDTTVQSLVAVAQAVDVARTWLTTQPERVGEALTLAREQAVAAATELRERLADLRPPALEELGLGAALGMLVGKSTLTATLTVTGTPRRLSENAELAAFRAAQEALANATRHADARTVDMRLHYTPDAVTLTVRDDGRGFDVPDDVSDLVFGGHYGLMGMRERVAAVGGTVAIDSTPAHGTTVTVTLPEAATVTAVERDPVCGAVIEPGRAYKQSTYNGRVYTFCCPVCQGAFEADPARYATPAP